MRIKQSGLDCVHFAVPIRADAHRILLELLRHSPLAAISNFDLVACGFKLLRQVRTDTACAANATDGVNEKYFHNSPVQLFILFYRVMIGHRSNVVTDFSHHANPSRKFPAFSILVFIIPECIKVTSNPAGAQLISGSHIRVVCPDVLFFSWVSTMNCTIEISGSCCGCVAYAWKSLRIMYMPFAFIRSTSGE